MKNILIIAILLWVVGCSTKTEKIQSGIAPFMKENYPSATYNIVINSNLNKLIINDQGDVLNKENMDSLMIETLGHFYLSFYQSSSMAATNSKFKIAYESKTVNVESKTYNLLELDDLFDFGK